MDNLIAAFSRPGRYTNDYMPIGSGTQTMCKQGTHSINNNIKIGRPIGTSTYTCKHTDCSYSTYKNRLCFKHWFEKGPTIL